MNSNSLPKLKKIILNTFPPILVPYLAIYCYQNWVFSQVKIWKMLNTKSLELNIRRKISLISMNCWKSIYVIQLWTGNGNERKSCKLSVDSAPSSLLQIPSNERDEMVLVCSGLKTNSDRIMYKNFIKKFDLREKSAIDKNVTHLVVSVNPQNCADRTLKFLQAITNKCWIIRYHSYIT